MDLLLFGSTGLLGRHLQSEFVNRGWNTCAPRRDDINLVNLLQVNHFVKNWLARTPNGSVIYAAGLTDIAKCQSEPNLAEQLNVITPMLLARLCKVVGARFVYFSTDQVFMDRTSSGFYQHHENDSLDHAFRTTQVYGASKADAERMIGLNPKYLIIRTSWLFGEHPTRSNFVQDVLRRAHRAEKINALKDYVACPSYAPDVAQATANLLADPDANGVYHLINGPAVCRYTMATTVLHHAGLSAHVLPKLQTEMGPEWIQRNPNGALHNTRRPPLRPWTDGLVDYLTSMHPDPAQIPA